MPYSSRRALPALLLSCVVASTACAGELTRSEAPGEGASGDPAHLSPDAAVGGGDGVAEGVGDGGAASVGDVDGGSPVTTRDAGAASAPAGSDGGPGSPPPTSDAGRPVAGGEVASPSSYMPERTLAATTIDGLYVYNPHTPSPFTHRGSAHTHCAPDHSGIASSVQETRLRDLANGNAHDFVWMTAHQIVAPDPGISGIVHMYGAEIYTGTLPSGGAPHVVALLPDGSLAGRSDPFGPRYQPFGDTVRAIADAGGLPVLAHPSRYSPSIGEVVDAPDVLWGAEIVSGGTDPADNAPYIDARLTAGRYLCLSAGGDIHDEDWSLTRGYQLVASDRADAAPAELLDRVRACDFFACRVRSDSYAPLDGLSVTVESGEIVFDADGPIDTIEFIGDGGRVLSSASGTSTARYRLSGDETYVRVRAFRGEGDAECFSQPLWVYRVEP